MSPRLPQNAADRARRAPERAPQSAGVWPIRQSRQNDIASRFQRESRPPTKSRPTRFTCSRTGPKRCRGAGIRTIPAFANALHRDAFSAEADRRRTEILRDVVDELAVGGQIENLPIDNPVVPDLRAHQQARALQRYAGRRDRIETAELLQRSGRGADIFERGLRHDAALVQAPVVAELGQSSVDVGVVAGAGGPEAGISARIDFTKAVDQCDGPGPWPPVDRGVDADLGEIERG